MNTFTYILSIILCCALIFPVKAQESNTRKLFLQSTIDAQSLNYGNSAFNGSDAGGGFSFRVGWGVSDLVTLHLGVNGSRLDGESNGVVNEEYEFGAFEIGSRFNLRSGSALVPFFDLSLRGVATQDPDLDLEFLGGGITIGGGVAYFVSRTVALNAGLRVGFGGFNDLDFGGVSAIDTEEIDFSEQRFSFGVVFYPLK